MKEITNEMVNTFLNGRDPMERIITIECGYTDDRVSIVYINEKGEKRIKMEDFKPFIWVKNSAAIRLFDGNRGTLLRKMREYGISVKALDTTTESKKDERLESGYKFLFYATRRMSNAQFMNFFTEGKVPVHERATKANPNPSSNREYMAVTPVEQYMIASGRRLFKGFNNYNDLLRLTFDLETQGLNPNIHRIEQIGIHTNRGYDKVIGVRGATEEELDKNELCAIIECLRIMAELKPDVIVGHNSENFDWDFIEVRLKKFGTTLEEVSQKFFPKGVYKKKKPAVLKLGGEVEYYRPTVIWGFSVLDSLHAARRAQALDSNMKKSNLKYLTKYLKMNKENRVYVPGDVISKTWNVLTKSYAFNNTNGDWYKISDTSPLKEGYTIESGEYIVERYLLDDIWETDKVEEKLNESNFLVGKMLPTTFTRTCTMGTAGIWKLIMLAWSYENDLAIPALGKNRRFVGGLSRLLKTGYAPNIVKLDYNSLYPSIILTWNIDNRVDSTNVLNKLLNYVLTEREKYKELKAQAGAKVSELKDKLKQVTDEEEKHRLKEEIQYWQSEKVANDKKQLPLKILGNSYFGSAGAEHIFPWGDNMAAERTTCIGRQSLRLMIWHFKKIGYTPVVGDSFTSDTPIFVKYDGSDEIAILPISSLVSKQDIQVDELGREYDASSKPFTVLCRSGWVKPQYIYRHKTNKPIYRVKDKNNTLIDVTEDHSLFNSEGKKIKPSHINPTTELEYYNGVIENKSDKSLSEKECKCMVKWIRNGVWRTVPSIILNANTESKRMFLEAWDKEAPLTIEKKKKSILAGIQYLRACIQ